MYNVISDRVFENSQTMHCGISLTCPVFHTYIILLWYFQLAKTEDDTDDDHLSSIWLYMYMKAELYYNQAGIIQRTGLKLTRHWMPEWLSHGKKRRDIFCGLLCEQRNDGIKIETVHQLEFQSDIKSDSKCGHSDSVLKIQKSAHYLVHMTQLSGW